MPDEIRDRICERFVQNVFGRQPDLEGGNQNHDGGAGHWFEAQMGVQHNADNAPDLWDYECKNATRSKTTFGDWKGDYLIWRDPEMFPNLQGLEGGMRGANSPFRIQQAANKDETFLPAFGRWRNADEETHVYELDGNAITWQDVGKDGYFSWSWIRKVVHGFGNEGQSVVVNNDNSISIIYSYSHDNREDRETLVPEMFRIENLTLVKWSENQITEFVENKFGVLGWFKGLMDQHGRYNALIFGEPISIDRFLEAVRNSDIYFDTRMKERRPDNTDRLGMNWRANNTFWFDMSDETFRPPEV